MSTGSKLAAQLGVEIPLVTARAEMIVTEPLPLLEVGGVDGNGLYGRQTLRGNLAYGGGPHEWVDLRDVRRNRAQSTPLQCNIARRLAELFPKVAHKRVIRSWAGFIENTPEGLAGKSIGVQGSTTNAEFIRSAYGKASEIRIYTTQDDCNADLLAGRIDVMFLDKLGDIAFLASADGAGFEEKGSGSVKVDPLQYGLGIGAGLRKSDTELKARIDQALTQLHASGKYTQISQKYFPVDRWPQ
ncbi:transporter substrate-binding domain-containing protein [Pseudomonas sp. LB3P31]